MPSRREAFEWVKKARELWPPDINKILEYYKKAEELRSDYHIIYKDKARLFHGLERFPEAVANYDLEIQKRRYDYEINKESPPEKFETDEEREEFERGQSRMEEMFEDMKQFGRDKAAQKIEPETIYPWEDQILYFMVMRDMSVSQGADEETWVQMTEMEKSLIMIIQNGMKNHLEKIGHARKYYHALNANNCTLLNKFMSDCECHPAMMKIMDEFKDDPNFEKEMDVIDKKFSGAERTLDNPKVEEAIKKFVDETMSKMMVNCSEEMALIVQKILEKNLLKTDHEN